MENIRFICKILQNQAQTRISMDPVKKQNQLLKQYVKTLEKQNNSKNNENFSLLQQLQKLTAELSNITSVRPSSQQQSVSKQQFLSLQNQLKELLRERNFMLQDFDKDMHQKTMECQHFQQEVKKLSQQNAKLKSSQMARKPTYAAIQPRLDEQEQKKIQQLQKETKRLRQKIEQKNQQNNSLRTELQKIVTELSFMVFPKKQGSIHNENRQVSQLMQMLVKTNRSKDSELQNAKQALNALMQVQIDKNVPSQQAGRLTGQLNQLQSAVIELEMRNNKLQRDKTNLQNKIRELQSQNIDKTMALVRLQKGQSIEQTYETSISVKDKQIKTLQIINQNLRNEIDSLGLTIQQKDITVKELEHRYKQLQQQLEQKIEIAVRCQKAVQLKNQQYNAMVQNYNDKISELTSVLYNPPQHDHQTDNSEHLVQMNNYIDDLTRQNTQLKQQLSKLHQTNQQIIQEMQNLRQDGNYKSKINQQGNQRNPLINQQIYRLKKENETLRIDAAKAQVPKTTSHQEKQYNAQLTKYVEDLEKMKNSLEKKLLKAQEEVKKLRQNNFLIQQLEQQNQTLKMQISKAQIPKSNSSEQHQYISQLSTYIEDLQKHKAGLQIKLKSSQEVIQKMSEQILLLKDSLQFNLKNQNQSENIIIQLRKQIYAQKTSSNQKAFHSNQTQKELKQLIKELRDQLRQVRQANQQLAAQRSHRSQSARHDSPMHKSRNLYTNYHWIGSQTGQAQLVTNPMQTFPEPSNKNKEFIAAFTSYPRSQIAVSSLKKNHISNNFGGLHADNSNYDVELEAGMGNRYDPYDIANLTRNAEMQVKHRQIQSKMVAHTDRAPNMNRQKWQNLQRKINSLRQQNEQLKKSLFE